MDRSMTRSRSPLAGRRASGEPRDQKRRADQKAQSEEESTSAGSEGTPEAVSETSAAPDETMTCGSMEDWLTPESSSFRCLRVPRTLRWDHDLQPIVDACSGAFQGEDGIEQVVRVSGKTEEQVATEFSNAAWYLAAEGRRAGLPGVICQQIERDAAEMASMVIRMVPTTPKVVMKLECFGESTCARWHQDNYTGRAIVTYNGKGTVYARHSNVDFWELENCGKSACILHDNSQVYSASAGDLLFMKGKIFPDKVVGLVHKSPEKKYHANGVVKHRLLLKVDLP